MYGYTDVINVIEAKGYPLNKADNYPNLIGIRKPMNNDNLFNDTLYMIIWKNNQQSILSFHYPITTDPGRWYLRHPINKDGCAIVKEGFYPNVWKVGKHNGKYTALIQTGGKIKVYRDVNKDTILDLDENTIQEGFFGINLHHAGIDSITIDNWSAGCQVFKKKEDFNEVMHHVAVSYSKSFNYTLINEQDIIDTMKLYNVGRKSTEGLPL